MRTTSRRDVRARTRGAPPSHAGVVLLLVFAYGAALGWAAWTKVLPWWVLPTLAVINLLTFFAYWQDKDAAERRRWRTSEATLHLWGLAGGWPLAWVAQQVLRHKSSKRAFQATYWGSVVMHLGAAGGLVWWLARPHA